MQAFSSYVREYAFATLRLMEYLHDDQKLYLPETLSARKFPQELHQPPCDLALSYAFPDSAQQSISTLEMPDHIFRCHAAGPRNVRTLRRQMLCYTVLLYPRHYEDALPIPVVFPGYFLYEQYWSYVLFTPIQFVLLFYITHEEENCNSSLHWYSSQQYKKR